MKILKRAKSAPHKFIVKKAFLVFGKRIEPAEEIEVKNEDDALGYVKRGLIVPADLPDPGTYIVLMPFFLPGSRQKYEAKAMELVSLRAQDGLRLMVEGFVIPRDGEQWRPMGRRLKRQEEIQANRKKETEAFAAKARELATPPGQKAKPESGKIEVKFKDTLETGNRGQGSCDDACGKREISHY